MASTRQVEFTIPASQVVSDVTYMPVLLDRSVLPDEMCDPTGSNAARSDGGDLRLYKNNDQSGELAREIVSFEYDSISGACDAKCQIWVSGATWVLSSASDTKFYGEYGDNALTDYGFTDPYGRNAVYDSSYAAVLHLSEDVGNGTVGEFADSTGNGNDGLLTTGTTISSTTSSHPWGGSWLDFNGGEVITLATSKSMLDSSELTISAWGNFDITSIYGAVFGNRWSTPDKNWVQMQSSGRVFLKATASEDFSDAAALVVSSNYLMHLTYNLSELSLHINGAYAGGAGAANTAGIVGANDYRIGTYYNNISSRRVNGKVGEVRARMSALSAQYINTEYNNQNSPSAFMSTGTPLNIGIGATQLSINNINQQQSTNNILLTQINALSIDPIAQSQTLPLLEINQRNVISINDMMQSHQNEIVSLTQAGLLGVQAVSQSQALDHVTLNQHSALGVNSTTQSQDIDNILLLVDGSLDVHPSYQNQTLNAITLTQHNALSAQSITQDQQTNNVNLSAGQQLDINNVNQTQYIDVPSLSASGVLVVVDVNQVQRIDSALLAQHGVLIVQDIAQFQALQSVGLGTVLGWLEGSLVIISALDGSFTIIPALDGALTIN